MNISAIPPAAAVGVGTSGGLASTYTPSEKSFPALTLEAGTKFWAKKGLSKNEFPLLMGEPTELAPLVVEIKERPAPASTGTSVMKYVPAPSAIGASPTVSI